MPVRDLEALFRPKSLALVATEDGPAARAALRMLDAGAGGVTVQRVGPWPGALTSLSDLPRAPELCVIAAPPAALPALLEEAGAKGARAAVLVGARAADDEALRDTVRATARRHGMRVLGPASTGVATPGHRLFAGAFHRPPRAGRVALVAQSGTLAAAVIDWAIRRDVGFSHVAVLGDMADIGFADVLDYLAARSECQAILLAMDAPTDARRFLSAARSTSRLKPVIVLRTGRHSAPGETPDRIFDAVFRRAGLLRVHDLEELFDALETLAVHTPVRGDRLAIVANGRGIGRLAADALVAGGGRLAAPSGPANPLDLGEAADGPAYAAALTRLRADPAVDAVLLLHAPTATVPAGDIARAVADAAAASAPTSSPGGHAVLTSWLGERDAERAAGELARHHVPVFDTPERAVRALLHAVAFKRNQELLTETPPSIPEQFAPDPDAARSILSAARWSGRRDLDEGAARTLLAAYGIALAPSGAVPLPGPDLSIAMEVDPLFGPVLTAGPVALLPPLNMKLAREGLAGTRSLDDSPAARDEAALLLVKVAQMVTDLDDLAALSLSPVRIGPAGARVYAASVRLTDPDVPRASAAIRPYPREMEQPMPLPDGRQLLVRPVLPEDEPALKALFARMTSGEIRLRFFAPKQELSHSVAARMTQIDYDRDMGLVIADAGAPGRAAVHGAVHLSSDADGDRAEFAIMVAHDMAGLGLGPVLMRRILDHARSRGMKEVFGEVLMENRSMLRLCEVLGFSRHSTPDDPGVMHVSLAL